MNPCPSENSNLASKLLLIKFLGFETPSLPGIFNPLDLWGEYGYFLELHNGGY